jgi:4-amino-4-deoxy-L-arabinose transferase-like glycosyltransferase
MFFQKLKENKYAVIFLAIMLVAIFLRTYEFHDWLKFTHDQARDAQIVSDILSGKQPLPLLGPKAGGTDFLLGPAYYYFSYVAAKIFGNHPDKLAYPSLFFSILAIPLLFLFMREYFDKRISLLAIAIMSVSYFFVANSRFSWNPNLLPFFSLLYLYAILKILNAKNSSALWWSVLAGVSLGIGIQLHTFFLVIMPVLTFCVFGYLFFQKYPSIWKKLFTILVVTLVLNGTQIISEIKTDWQNTQNFLQGTSNKSKNNFDDSVLWVAACQIQVNTYFLSSLQDIPPLSDKYACKNILNAPSKKFIKSLPYYSSLAASTIFSLLGYFLLWHFLRKEKDEKKKNFLRLVGLFNLIAFLVFIPVANVLFLGYFIMLLPVPFVLFGLFLKMLSEKYGRRGELIGILLTVALIIAGFARDYEAVKEYNRGARNNSKETTLENIESISQYILSNSGDFHEPYFYGKGWLGGRFSTPLKYFIQEAGKDIKLVWSLDDDEIEPGIPLFYVKDSSKEIIPGEEADGRKIVSGKRFQRQVILILEN